MQSRLSSPTPLPELQPHITTCSLCKPPLRELEFLNIVELETEPGTRNTYLFTLKPPFDSVWLFKPHNEVGGSRTLRLEAFSRASPTHTLSTLGASFPS